MARLLRIGAGVAALAVLGVAGAGAGGMFTLQSNISTVSLPPPLANPEHAAGGKTAQTGTFDNANEPTNILLLGSDARIGGHNSDYGDPVVEDTARADTTMLVHLSAGRQWAQIVSIPRDLVTNIPTNTSTCGGTTDGPTHTRFNAAYTYGGPACTALTVENLTGLAINHVAVVDFSGFSEAVDALGGYKVCLTKPVQDEDSKLNLGSGLQQLNGEQTLSLVRARKMLSDGSDISRTARQQYVVTTLAAQVKASGVLTNPITAWNVANILTSALTLDKDLSKTSTLLAAADQLSSLNLNNVYTSTLPWIPDPENPENTVVVDQIPADKLIENINTDTRPTPAKPTPADPTSASPTPGTGSAAKPTKPLAAPDPIFCQKN